MRNWVLGEWGAFRDFAKRETFPCILFFAVGNLLGALARLLFVDPIFHQVLLARYGNPPKIAYLAAPYALYALTIAGAIVLVVLLKLVALLRRALRSWAAGVCSGMSAVSFLSALLFCAPSQKLYMSDSFGQLPVSSRGTRQLFASAGRCFEPGRPADPKDLRVGTEPSNSKIDPVDFDEPICVGKRSTRKEATDRDRGD